MSGYFGWGKLGYGRMFNIKEKGRGEGGRIMLAEEG
ncbi:6-carboxyhexanoate--CoA ligase, partial [Staphylococcus epidermidis]